VFPSGDVEKATISMSSKELDRLHWVQRMADRRATQRQAAEALGLTVRQVQRLRDAYEAHGAAGLVSARRGKRSNRALPDAYKTYVVELVRERYVDFGPTLAREKLAELHGVSVALETLRKWLSEAGVWQTRAARRARPQPPRARRDCFGELVQIDGCDHEWFEDRGPRCTLLVYVDDATSSLMELRFARSESTFDYFAATESYLGRYGKPVAFYSDKLSVFRVNAQEAIGGMGYTQFGRAMRDLNIDVICANTPAAKGRVERAHQTLQDRLVKELRLRGISDRDAGNAYLGEFREDYNRRFARAPKSPRDAHRPLLPHDDLRRAFSWQEQRRLTRNLTLHYKRVLYVVDRTPASEKARGHRVDVCEFADGSVQIEYRGVVLPACSFAKDSHVTPGAVVENKLLGHTLSVIAAAQRERDEMRLNEHRMTLRDQDNLRRAVTASFSPPIHDPGKRVAKPSTYAPMPLTITRVPSLPRMPEPSPALSLGSPALQPAGFEPVTAGDVPEPAQKRRRRGRPRKHPLPDPLVEASSDRRRPGRPRKHPVPTLQVPRKPKPIPLVLTYENLPPTNAPAVATNPLSRLLTWAKQQVPEPEL
jgi:hypothetical protein